MASCLATSLEVGSSPRRWRKLAWRESRPDRRFALTVDAVLAAEAAVRERLRAAVL